MCKQARLEAAMISRDKDPSNVNNDGSVSIPTGFDVSWKQRGYTSHQGLVAGIDQNSGKVIDVHHMINSCRKCTQINNPRETKKIDDLTHFGKLVAHTDQNVSWKRRSAIFTSLDE